VADSIFALPLEKVDTWHARLCLLAYTLQIYCDFSGYSDMAIGLAHMFSIQLSENFNYPYIALLLLALVEISGVTRILPVVGLIGARLGNFCSVRCLFLQNYWDPLFVDKTKSFDGRTE
jgi:hypothetical protein